MKNLHNASREPHDGHGLCLSREKKLLLSWKPEGHGHHECMLGKLYSVIFAKKTPETVRKTKDKV